MSTSRDSFQIVKHISVKRLINLFQLKFSYFISRIFKKSILWGKPYALSIEPTTACNLGCPECPSGLKKFTRETGKLDVEFHQKMLQSIGKQVFYINYYFQFLVVKQNEHEVKAVFELAKELKIDEVRLKSAQLYDYKNGNSLMPEGEEYSRYKRKKDGTYVLKYETGNHCWRMWSSSVLTWDGKVVPCCFDKDAQHILGSVAETDFESIWESKKYQSFRKSILTNRNSIDICQNCSEGAKVWV